VPTFEQFRLPDAGEGLTEAEIVAWHVAVGDEVTVNQTIVEIETAKSLVELPSPFTGVVAQLLVQPGTTVEVGAPIIVIDVDPTGSAAPAPAASPVAARLRPRSVGRGRAVVLCRCHPDILNRQGITQSSRASRGIVVLCCSAALRETSLSRIRHDTALAASF